MSEFGENFQPNSDKISAPQTADVIIVGTHGATNKIFCLIFLFLKSKNRIKKGSPENRWGKPGSQPGDPLV